MEELRKIALELLEHYASDGESLIYEFSGRIDEDLAELAVEVAEYRRRIDEAC
ncbi:hypothetical protein M6D81_11540 [Paenibacillus sp. J5C_2022]|uniref:hypothetical protein n=1 Tax=Paenibacillus sp. J5C2022 TaxID=2977129 RepID=UPI0021D2287F|nr:hypothetical protein [Paenibacillus sp. J5C2022]MCU6709340.1 hypothetical protein [Paenibacillus sp. J5C2022]